MLSTNAQKAAACHRRQNSTPIASNSAMYAALATTNLQQSLHRRGSSTGYSAHPQDLGQATSDGKVSINSNGHSGQHHTRAAQMPASSRPGQTDPFFIEHFSTDALQNHNQDLTKINEESEVSVSRFQASGDEKPEGRHDILSSFIDHADNKLGETNPAAAMLLEFMEKMNSFSNQDVRQALQEVGSKYENGINPCNRGGLAYHVHRIPGNLVGLSGGTQSASSVPMRRGQSWQEQPVTARSSIHGHDVPKPPHTVPLRSSATFDVASYPSTTFPDFSDLKGDLSVPVGGYSSSNYSPMTNRSGISSFQSSPELAPISLFGSQAPAAPELRGGAHEGAVPASSPSSLHKRKNSTVRKGEGNNQCSDDEVVFRPEDFLIPSNVTDEEINAFIQGPDESGKYLCLYENCKNAPFGRKENIRAHVQTHLDDRRYQCDSCRNKFVRPNDLKRHWQIHVNKRDFKCFCGAAFNRHDALKRHRERSEWCESGGTRGSPDSPKKDEKKRGRPKKIAPTESQERRERKAMIRREVRKKQAASAASSVASMESPPPDFDFGEYTGSLSGHQQTVSPSHTSLTPPASPSDEMEGLFQVHSAHARNNQSNQSLSPPPTRDSMLSFGLAGNSEGLMFADLEPTLPGEGGNSGEDSSQRGTPPSLDMGSSSPPRLFDFDLSSDQVMLSQADLDFGSMSRVSGSKPSDMFSDLTFWEDPKPAGDSFIGMNPGRLDVTLPHNRNSDPLFW